MKATLHLNYGAQTYDTETSQNTSRPKTADGYFPQEKLNCHRLLTNISQSLLFCPDNYVVLSNYQSMVATSDVIQKSVQNVIYFLCWFVIYLQHIV